jgi:hypothetical protein
MTTRRMRIARWIPKATNTNSEYVMLIAFPLQHWLHERALILRYTLFSCVAVRLHRTAACSGPIVRPQVKCERIRSTGRTIRIGETKVVGKERAPAPLCLPRTSCKLQ